VPSAAAEEAITVVGFAGAEISLDGEVIESLRAQLGAIASEPGQAHLLLDFRNVRYISGMALATLVTLYKNLRATGRRLALDNVRPLVHEVFAITRLDTLFDVRPAEQEAGSASENGRADAPTRVLVARRCPRRRVNRWIKLAKGG
jgi:anti-anti-sigma factor